MSLKILQFSQENTWFLFFFNKYASLRPANFIKKETSKQIFSCEFCQIFKNIFFIDYLQWVLLFISVLQLTVITGHFCCVTSHVFAYFLRNIFYLTCKWTFLECKKAFLDWKNYRKHLQFFKNNFSKIFICYKSKFLNRQLGSTFAIIF